MPAIANFISSPRLMFRRSASRAALALGLAWVLPAWAAFTGNADGTVTDTTTGLVWDRCAYGLSGPTCSTGTALLADWSTALTTAVTANAASYKGLTGWRLPNRSELESLVDLSTSQPAINSTAFPNTPWDCNVVCGAFWSSTSYAPNPAYAWIVSFYNGLTNANYTTNSNYVRLVRSGQSLAPFDLLGSVPTLSAVGASGTTGTATTLSGTSSAAGTGYWLVVPTGSTAPTAAQVKAGVTYTGGTVAAAGNGAMTAATAKAFSVNGLASQTAYAAYLMAEDGSGVQSAVSGPTSFTTLDVTAPITSSGPSVTAGPTQTTASVGVTVNEGGTGYYLVQPTANAAPSVATLVASGSTVALTANVAATVNLTGLTAGTAYTLYFVAKDATGNTQAAASNVGFTTQAAAVVRTYVAASPSGSGSITASFTGGGAGCDYASSQYSAPVAPPAGVVFPQGVFSFTTNNCGAAASLSFTLTYPQVFPAGTVYYKYNGTSWAQYPATITGNQITFTITDNGAGDTNPAVGFITDPGGPGIPGGAGATGVPTLSTWGLALLAALLGVLGLRAPAWAGRRRRGG